MKKSVGNTHFILDKTILFNYNVQEVSNRFNIEHKNRRILWERNR